MRKPIPGCTGYAVDKLGRIYGPTGNLKSARLGANGYLRVNVQRDGKKAVIEVHRAVAYAWHGEPPTPEHHAGHLNGVKIDNRPENVAWMTASENQADRANHGVTFEKTRLRIDEGTVFLLRRAGMSWGKISRTLNIPDRSLRRNFGDIGK